MFCYYAVLVNLNAMVGNRQKGKVGYSEYEHIFSWDERKMPSYEKALEHSRKLNRQSKKIKYDGHAAKWLPYYKKEK